MITQPFKQAIKARDMERVKIMLRGSLSTDLTFEKFKEMLAYTVDRVPDIIEPHDSKPFPDRSHWTKAYASEVREDLMRNFSAERIEHLQAIHEHVYASELQRQLQKERENTAASKEKRPNATSSVHVTSLVAAVGVGAASILVGVLMNLSIVQVATTAVVMTLVVGGVTYYLVKQKQ